MTQKEFADELGLHYVGNDFDFHLKKIHHIKNFELGQTSINAFGDTLEIHLYEEPRDQFGSKAYILVFNVYCLVDPTYYTSLD